jgi:hypothetical protein
MDQSIPMVCQNWTNTRAAYRFFSNDRVSEADILAGHLARNADRSRRWSRRAICGMPGAHIDKAGLELEISFSDPDALWRHGRSRDR